MEARRAGLYASKNKDEIELPRSRCKLRCAELGHECGLIDALDAPDPLLALLRRYQAELKAFDDGLAPDGITDEDWDRIAQDTWVGTRDEIIRLEPPAKTTAAAILALDHALQSDILFVERSESADLQMLWQLIKAARDYISSIEKRFPLLRH